MFSGAISSISCCWRPSSFLSAPATAGSLSPTPIGVFRSVRRPTYDRLMTDQLDDAARKLGSGKLTELLTGSDTWTIS